MLTAVCSFKGTEILDVRMQPVPEGMVMRHANDAARVYPQLSIRAPIGAKLSERIAAMKQEVMAGMTAYIATANLANEDVELMEETVEEADEEGGKTTAKQQKHKGGKKRKGEQVQQATRACLNAYQNGVKRQYIEVLLPLIGATDLDDWPGGIRQQFKAAAPLVEQLLKQLKQQPGLEGPLAADIWDQGDAVGAWYGERLAAVLFPTAFTLERVRGLADAPSGGPEVLMIVNPQWELKGGLVSDFGFGASAAKAMDFIASFEPTYHLKQLRVYGDDVRLLRAYPGPWQIMGAVGEGFELVATSPNRPTYHELEAALRAWPRSQTKKGLLERFRDELAWTTDSLKGPPQ